MKKASGDSWVIRALALVKDSRWTGLFRANTLSRMILTGVLPAVMMVTAVLGAYGYYVGRRHILLGVQKEMDTLAGQAAQGLQAFFRQRLNDLESISETPLINDYLKNHDYGLTQEADMYQREMTRYFAKFADRSQVYLNIAYYGPDGRLVASLLPAAKDSAARSGSALPREVFAAPRGGAPYEAPLKRLGSKGPLFRRYVKNLSESHGESKGTLVLDCDMTPVENVLRKLRVGEIGGAFLEEYDGKTVLGQRPSLLRPLTGKASIPATQWRMVVAAEADEFLKPLREVKIVTAVLTLLAGFLVLVLIVRRVHASMRPIQSMVEGTQRFAAGDLSYRFPEPGTRELKILAASFNRMAEALQERTRELEQRLRQLTALRGMEKAVIQRLDEETILRTCLEAVAQGFSFDRTALYWVDWPHNEVVGRYVFGTEAMGFTEKAFRHRRVPLGGHDILNDVIVNRAPVLVKDLDDNKRLNDEFLLETKTREFVMAPVCGKERVLGVLTADNYYSGRVLSEGDRDGLSLFANAVGLALENTALFQNLAESEARYRRVLENSPEAIIGLSREQWITTWNRGAEHIFGFSARDMVGKPFQALFPAPYDEEFRRLINAVVQKGFVRDYSLPCQNVEGKALELSLSWGGTHPDFWLNREWTVVIRDVTEAKKMQMRLIRSEKLSAVGQLISGIAHELNNPLQAVVGYADLLWEEMKTSVAEKADVRPVEGRNALKDLQVITENAMRCRKIIENLLLFVRQGEIEKKPILLERVIQASLDLLQYKLKKSANIQVGLHLPERPTRVVGNFQQIQQVFVNLINNACDAMGGWSGPKMLTVHVHPGAQQTRVEVVDSGPGVPDSARERLFEPFFTTKAEGRGTGLGLAVCRQIIEDHGGRIDFACPVGGGTAFFFSLPTAPEGAGLSRAVQPSLPAVEGRSVLVVDDEMDVLSFVRRVVENDNDCVETAASLKDAAALVAQGNFDMVIADIRLGEGTGLELYDNWSLWSARPRPAFLFMTGDVINPALVSEIEKKGLTLMHKPVNMEAFQNTFRGLLLRKKP